MKEKETFFRNLLFIQYQNKDDWKRGKDDGIKNTANTNAKLNLVAVKRSSLVPTMKRRHSKWFYCTLTCDRRWDDDDDDNNIHTQTHIDFTDNHPLDVQFSLIAYPFFSFALLYFLFNQIVLLYISCSVSKQMKLMMLKTQSAKTTRRTKKKCNWKWCNFF